MGFLVTRLCAIGVADLCASILGETSLKALWCQPAFFVIIWRRFGINWNSIVTACISQTRPVPTLSIWRTERPLAVDGVYSNECSMSKWKSIHEILTKHNENQDCRLDGLSRQTGSSEKESAPRRWVQTPQTCVHSRTLLGDRCCCSL